MRKLINIITIISISITLTACSFLDKNTSNNVSTNNSNNENVENIEEEMIEKQEELSTIKASTALTDEDNIYLYTETLDLYNAETLPVNYERYDFDMDGLKNSEEVKNRTNMYKMDTDNDGISDFDEINHTMTNPTKWSSRDDNISDMEWSILNNVNFKSGYSTIDGSDYKVYLEKQEDQLYLISKVSINIFDELETITGTYQIKNFSGKMALDCSKYDETVPLSIDIYKIENEMPQKLETIIEDNCVTFNVNENDIFVAVYNGK